MERDPAVYIVASGFHGTVDTMSHFAQRGPSPHDLLTSSTL